MIKKALYIITSGIIALMLTLVLMGYNFLSSMQSHIAEDVANENYTSAEKYYAIALDSNKFYSADAADGTHIEVLPAVNTDNGVVIQKNSEGEDTPSYYSAYESSIQISLFKLSSEFALEGDTLEDQKGKVVVTVADKTITFPFIKKVDASIDESYTSYYTSYASFQYFTACIFYDEYVAELDKLGLPETTVISKMEIYDAAGTLKYTVADFKEGNEPSFNSSFHSTVQPLCAEYNAQQVAKITEDKEVTVDLAQLKVNFEEAFAAIPETTFANGYEISIILASKECLLPTAIGMLMFMIIDVALAVLLFRKKKHSRRRNSFSFGGTNYGNYSQTKKIEAPAPEQFSRDVFNIKDEILASEYENTTTESSVETEEQKEVVEE